MHIAGAHPGTVNGVKKNRRQHTKERVCVGVCFPSCLWAQMGRLVPADRRKHRQVGHHNPPTPQGGGERRDDIKRNTDGGSAHMKTTFQTVFHTEKTAEGEGERQRESPEDGINVWSEHERGNKYRDVS